MSFDDEKASNGSITDTFEKKIETFALALIQVEADVMMQEKN